MRKFFSLEDCLYLAFAGVKFYDPQDPSRMWAILEGLERLKTLDSSWRSVDARKIHNCVRGCTIPAESTYFHWALGGGAWDDRLKICASCMAMILFYKEVQHLPCCLYTHWDTEMQKPVKIPKDDA
jgi:hypothetical protein